MERRITERYGNAILREAMARYGIADDQIRPLEATENFVYQFERAGRSYILRVGHSLRRSEALVRGELDWVNQLAAAGVSVAPAVPSRAGNLVEAVDDGADGRFLVTAFVKARGRSPHDRWTPALYAAFGELLGRMHASAEHYQPPRPDWKRPEWDDEIMDLVARHLPGSERVAKQKYQDGSATSARFPGRPVLRPGPLRTPTAAISWRTMPVA
jgi:Ser/Thr protein kinase RdoA (MazF antagonist)